MMRLPHLASSAAFVCVILGVMLASGGELQDARCQTIRATLERLGNTLTDTKNAVAAKQREISVFVTPEAAPLRSRAEADLQQLQKAQADAEAQIKQLRDQEAAQCGTGTAPSSPNAATSPAPPGMPSAGSNAASPSSADWDGDWSHDFGTMTLRVSTGSQVTLVLDDRLKGDNAFGPNVGCDRRVAYSGEVVWTRAGGGFDRPWNGQIFACTNGTSLEGKISNFGAHSVSEPDRSASFTIAIVDRVKNRFDGRYRIYDIRTKVARGDVQWFGKGPETAEIALQAFPGTRGPQGPSEHRYIGGPGTALIPAELAQADRPPQMAVRAGDKLLLRNIDTVYWRPFSKSKENAFQTPVPGLAPTQSMIIVARNPTREPVRFVLFDDIHSYSRFDIVVLPAEANGGAPR